MRPWLAIVGAALSSAPALPAASPAPTFVYCSAQSTSQRGPGLIVTTIFPARLELAFIRSAFVNYLRTSYAPYGNGWVFSEDQASCVGFPNRRRAEIQKALDVSRVPQPTQSVFTVSFQIG